MQSASMSDATLQTSTSRTCMNLDRRRHDRVSTEWGTAMYGSRPRSFAQHTEASMSTHDEYAKRFQAGNWKPRSERPTMMANPPNGIPVERVDGLDFGATEPDGGCFMSTACCTAAAVQRRSRSNG